MNKLFSLVIVLLSTTAFAFEFPINKKVTALEFSKILSNQNQYDFEGIVALSNCSGSLIQLEGVSDANNALVLTNGHCLDTGFTNPGQFVYNQPSKRTFTLLKPDSSRAGDITATQVVYATMTGTDIAIYKVRETYADIKAKFGIRPMVLSSQHPEVGTPMEVISGYWRYGYSCQIEAFIPELREANWVMKDSIRYSRPGCETIGGTSGSPIVQAGTKTVIGINNTGNEDGLKCAMNNPCEVDKDGNVTAHKDYSYGQQTYQIYSCLTATNEINLSVPGCQLLH